MSFTTTATSGRKEWLFTVMPCAFYMQFRSASNYSLPSLSLSKQADYLVERGRMASLDWCFILSTDSSGKSLLTFAAECPISLLAVEISEFSIRDPFWMVSGYRSDSPSPYSICMSDVGLGGSASALGQGATSYRCENCSPFFIQSLYFLRKATSSSKAAILRLQLSIASCIWPSKSAKLFRYKFSISSINDDTQPLSPSFGLSLVGYGGAGSLLPCRQSCLMTRQLGADCETTPELITLQTNRHIVVGITSGSSRARPQSSTGCRGRCQYRRGRCARAESGRQLYSFAFPAGLR